MVWGLHSDSSTSVRAVVTKVNVSAEGARVVSIAVRTEAGDELTMRLSESIDPALWAPRHLQAHMRLGQTLGATIGIKYIQTPEAKVVTELSE